MRKTARRYLVASAMLCGVLSNAHATPMLHLTTSAGGNATVSDSDGDGIVSFGGPLAGWAINLTSGLSKPALGSANMPILDLISFNLSSDSTGSINIWLTDTDFTGLTSPTSLTAAIGGTTFGGNISYQTYFDPSNTAFGTADLITNIGPLDTAAFSSSVNGVLPSTTGPFSLTMLVTITHDSPGQFTSFDATMKVPEPSTLLLLGIGSLAFAFAMRRRIWTAPAQ
jgi:hypothetical protein